MKKMNYPELKTELADAAFGFLLNRVFGAE
jgi:hypothetical protein